MPCKSPCVYHDAPDEYPDHQKPCKAKRPSLPGWNDAVGGTYDLSRAICKKCDHLASCHQGGQ